MVLGSESRDKFCSKSAASKVQRLREKDILFSKTYFTSTKKKKKFNNYNKEQNITKEENISNSTLLYSTIKFIMKNYA